MNLQEEGWIYLINLGTLKDLHNNKSFEFRDMYNVRLCKHLDLDRNKCLVNVNSNDICVYKFGKTNNISKRFKTHEKNFKFCYNTFNVISTAKVPLSKLTLSENKVKEYFLNKNYYFVTYDTKNIKYKELVVILNEDLPNVLELYNNLCDK
jgi:hypothetical protein